MLLQELLTEYFQHGQALAGRYPGMFLVETQQPGDMLTFSLRVFFVERGRKAPLIGRAPDADLRVRNVDVSSRHARLYPPRGGGGTWRIEDLDSTNGTFIDGERLPSRRVRYLQGGESIRLGPSIQFDWLTPEAFLGQLRSHAGDIRPVPQVAPRKPSARRPERPPLPAGPAAAGPAPAPTRRPAPEPPPRGVAPRQLESALDRATRGGVPRPAAARRPERPERRGAEAQPARPRPGGGAPGAPAAPRRGPNEAPPSAAPRAEAPPSAAPRAEAPPAAPPREPPASPLERGAAPAAAGTATGPAVPEEPTLPPEWEAPQTRLGEEAIRRLLEDARGRGASDLHLTPGMPPVLRINGQLEATGGAPLSAEDLRAMVWQVTDRAQREQFVRTGDLDACVTFGEDRYRTNVCRQRLGPALTIRLVDRRPRTLEELGVPEAAQGLTTFAQGLVLVTGPLGAGKTTTTVALVDLVNADRPDHVIVIEDPIEFVFQPRRCQISQRQLGTHTASFAAALRGALREDPDVIMIGDLRDYETASLAISAAETGHLVFASMAAVSAAKTIDKLIDLFPASEQGPTRVMVSESLRGILCQRLLPGVDGRRVLAVELLLNSVAIANVIRGANTAALSNALQLGRSQGMRTLGQSLDELVAAGQITRETADAALEL